MTNPTDWTPVAHQGPSLHRIPRWLAEEAYTRYAAKYGSDQSLNRMLQRGGFDDRELDVFVPGWRERIDRVRVLEARVTELEAQPTCAMPAGAVEWLRRHYAAYERVDVRATRCFGSGRHQLTELEVVVDGGEPTMFLVAEDVGADHPGGTVGAPTTYGTLVHVMANATAEELVVIGARLNIDGVCPRFEQPHPPGEPLGFTNGQRVDLDAGVGFSATEPVDNSGELPLELDVYGIKGTAWLSKDMWLALGEHAGWTS